MTMDFKKPNNKPCPGTGFVAQPVLERGPLLIEEIYLWDLLGFDRPDSKGLRCLLVRIPVDRIEHHSVMISASNNSEVFIFHGIN
jgi:hypothetical protein